MAAMDAGHPSAIQSWPEAELREGLTSIDSRMGRSLRERPSAAKAAFMAGSNGTAEAVPYPSYPKKNLVRSSLGGAASAATHLPLLS